MTSGTLLAGRYRVAGPAPRPGRFLVHDLARAGRPLELLARPIDTRGWTELAPRLTEAARLRGPGWLPLTDFVALDGTRCIATARPGPDLTVAAAPPGSLDAASALAAAAALAARLEAAGLEPAALDPRRLGVAGGQPVLSALDVVPAGTAPPSPEALLAALRPHAAEGSPAARLLDRLLERPPSGATALLAELAAAGIALPAPSRTDPPFVGRGAELAQLEGALRDLGEAGRGGVLVVAGLAGAGKTRLVSHFRFAARQEGLALAEAFAGEPGPIYGALAVALAQIAASASPAFLWRHGDELARMVPGLRAGVAPTDSAAGETERLRMFDAAVALVREVAARRPLLLRLADLHRADPAVIDLLRPLAVEVARNPSSFSCLLLAEVREPLDADSPLGSLVAQLRRASGFGEIRLGPLDAKDAAALVGGPAAAAPRSGGLPGALLAAVAGASPRPARAASGRLSAGERALLEAFSTLDRPAELSVAAAVAGIPRPERAAQALQRRGLLRRSGEAGQAYEVVAPLPAARSGAPVAALHARAAQALRAVGAPAGELVRHLERAGKAPDLVAAALEGLAAAREARAWPEAVAFARAALEGLTDPIERARLQREAAGLAELAGQPREAARLLAEHEAVSGDTDAETLLERARLTAAGGEIASALALTARAVDRAGNPEQRAAALLLEARLHAGAGAGERAERTLQRVRRALAGRAPAGELRADIELTRALVDLARGRLVAARAAAEAALAASGGPGGARRRRRALSLLGSIHYAAGELDPALARYREALALCERDHDLRGSAELIGNLGAILFNRDQVAEAGRHFARSLELREKVGDARGAALAMANLGLVAAAQRRHADARRLLEEALRAAEATGDRAQAAFAELALGQVECEAGAAEAGLARLDRAARAAHRRGDRRSQALALALAAGERARAGRPAHAVFAARAALALARRHDLLEARGLAHRALALAHAAQGRRAAAERAFAAARAAFDSGGNVFEARRTAEARERALPSGRPPATAGSPVAALLAAALDDFDRVEPATALERLARCAGARAGFVVAARDGEEPAVLAAFPPDAAPPDPALAHAALAALERAAGPIAPFAPAGGQAVALALGKPGHAVLLPGAAVSGDVTALAALVRPLEAALARSAAAERPPRPPGARGFGGLVGQTEVMQRLFALLERVATNDLPVLLVGESGTGKERVARAIHAGSPRAARPFVAIDCAAIPESLIESELFGHRRGAFTGAASDRKGLFEEAQGGTVLLDEVANIPLPIQAKLLRVLQEREVRRIGETTVRPIDVRVIAATNQPLEAVVREGGFREDLFFRLNVIEIVLPPLRERADDIPLLVAEILARLADPPPAITREALDLLMAWDWPGNVRELENELSRALALARGGPIREADLSPRLTARGRPGNRPAPGELRLRAALDGLERDLLRRALEATGGHRARTARLLGLSLQGLHNKLRKHGLTRPGVAGTGPRGAGGP